jgi:WD40 repeat protein
VTALDEAGQRRSGPAHDGAAILVAAASGTALLTGGEDGTVRLTGLDLTTTLIRTDGKRRWVTALVAGPDGAVATAYGRDIVARDGKGREKTLTADSTAQGLVFAPKGYRLAIAQYGGVKLWYPNLQTAPEWLDWKGAHIDVTWSKDGRFIVTTMQENALHGWRLGDKPGHMRMTGYPTKPRAMSWSHDGLWLATSGADACIVWPFQGDGPMGKAPRECGVRPAKVSAVAFHPHAYVLAVGYDDGCILMIRLTDGSELLVRPAVKGSAVTALGWCREGRHLGFGCADGVLGRLKLPG